MLQALEAVRLKDAQVLQGISGYEIKYLISKNFTAKTSNVKIYYSDYSCVKSVKLK